MYICGEQKQKEMEKLTKEQMEVVKREHPEWFNEIEVGKWYDLPYFSLVICVTELEICNNGRFDYMKIHYYGFDKGAFKTGYISTTDLDADLVSANMTKVKKLLVAEAKRRYKVGDRIKGGVKGNGKRDFILTRDPDMAVYIEHENQIRIQFGMGNEIGAVIFHDGQWASVLTPEKPSLQDDIQALKDRWPDINFTVIAEEKK